MNEKKIEKITLRELFRDNVSDGEIPILAEIQHKDIKWADSSLDQENGYLRVVNNNVGVKYDGKTYLPCQFKFQKPTEDGKQYSNTTISISAIDQRIIDVIETIKEKPKIVIDAFYTRLDEDRLAFSKLYKYEFEMSNANWDFITATWTLSQDKITSINLPKDLATTYRCKGVNLNA